MATMKLLLLLALYSAGIHMISSLTDPNDVAALLSLKGSWKNAPPNWENSTDPCELPWFGVACDSPTRVTGLRLVNISLVGELSDDIGRLTGLVYLDLSLNPGLTGSLTPRLADLQNLLHLNLRGCHFTGNIPEELGNIEVLSYLQLKANNFTGTIPPSLGKLSNLEWFDLSENQLTGPIPISTSTSPGLDQLLKATDLLLNNNQLSGSIPPKLFSSGMAVIHVQLNQNKFAGSIPITLGLVPFLGRLRLDGNNLTGSVPSTFKNLKIVNELNLANNKLTGPFPDLSGMTYLSNLDLSNNSFDPTEAPHWFNTLPFQNLVIEFGPLQGPVPDHIFFYPGVLQVKLRNNAFNGTLNLGQYSGEQLQLVDFENNQISKLAHGEKYKNALMLKGNPICSGSNSTYCQ